MSGTRLEPAATLRKLRNSETSNLSEVCSGSDCHDNNMGALTKWDKNPAQVPPIGLFFCNENDELLEKGKKCGCALSIYVLVFIHEIISDYCATVGRVLLNTPVSLSRKIICIFGL